MLCPHCWIPKGFAVSLFWLPQECLMPTVSQGKIKGVEQQGIPQSCLIKEPGQILKANWCQNLFLHVKKRVKVNQKGWKGDIEINKEIKVQVANILPKVFSSVFSFKVLFKKKTNLWDEFMVWESGNPIYQHSSFFFSASRRHSSSARDISPLGCLFQFCGYSADSYNVDSHVRYLS